MKGHRFNLVLAERDTDNHHMTNAQLVDRYRNLLIHLAKTRESLRLHVAVLRAQALSEQSPGRKAGLGCRANAVSDAASKLQFALSRNRDAMRHMFGTTKLEEVALANLEGD